MNIKKLEKKLSSDAQVVFIKEQSKVFGILGLVFGLLSIFLLAVLFVPLGLIFCLFGLLKRDSANIALSVLGLLLCLIGFLTSPFLMSLIGFGLMG